MLRLLDYIVPSLRNATFTTPSISSRTFKTDIGFLILHSWKRPHQRHVDRFAHHTTHKPPPKLRTETWGVPKVCRQHYLAVSSGAVLDQRHWTKKFTFSSLFRVFEPRALLFFSGNAVQTQNGWKKSFLVSPRRKQCLRCVERNYKTKFETLRFCKIRNPILNYSV